MNVTLHATRPPRCRHRQTGMCCCMGDRRSLDALATKVISNNTIPAGKFKPRNTERNVFFTFLKKKIIICIQHYHQHHECLIRELYQIHNARANTLRVNVHYKHGPKFGVVSHNALSWVNFIESLICQPPPKISHHAYDKQHSVKYDKTTVYRSST